MSTKPAAKNPLLVSREQARNTLADAIRLFVGTNRRYSVKQLSNGSGVPDWQINAALIDGASPDSRPLPPEAVMSIMRFLGADFTNEWIGLTGQGAFDFPEGSDRNPGQVMLGAAQDTATIARCAADGEFDAQDRKDLAVVGRRKIETGMRLVAAAKVAA